MEGEEMKDQKKTKNRKFYMLTIALSCFLAITLSAQSGFSKEKSFPSKTIEIVSPYGPGGTNDTISRTVAKASTDFLGQNIIVKNMPGAGGVIGTKYVERAKPNGYTLVMASSSTIFTSFMSKTPNNIENLAAVVQICSAPPVLVARSDSPWKNLWEFITAAKKSPGTITMANSGTGASAHIYTSLLEIKAGIKFKNIPYKGFAAAIAAVMGNHANATVVLPGVARQYVKAGDLRILGVASEGKFSIFPDAPTFKESGVDMVIEHWVGLMTSKKTPAEIIETLVDGFAKGINTAEVQSLLKKRGLEPKVKKSATFQKFIDKETPAWEKVIKELKKSM